jgi:hypothetical protein
MLVRLAFSLCVIAVLVAAPAAAEATSAVRPTSVSRHIVVPSGAATTVHLTCPDPSVALNGAVVRQGARVTVRRSTPGAKAGDWSFRLSASAGAAGRSVALVLRCVRLELPSGITGARLHLNTRTRTDFAVPPGGTTAVQLGCGPAWLATGYGFERGARDDVVLAEAVPGAHGWRFLVENTGSTPATAGLSVRCLRKAVTARTSGGGLATLGFRAARPSFSATFAASEGRRAAFRKCGTSRFALAGGTIVDAADSIEFLTSGPTGARGIRWLYRNVTNGDRFQAFLVCLRTGSGFH